MVRLTEWSHEQLMYVDESAANERTLDRKYGWAPIGQKATIVEPFTRSKKWSILPVYTQDGFIDYEIIHGSYNAEMFKDFLRNHVIPHTTPFPGPRSVLIMDNAKIHRDEVLQDWYSTNVCRRSKKCATLRELCWPTSRLIRPI